MKDERICHTVRRFAVTPSDDLSPSQYRQLQEHLSVCTDCTNVVRNYEALKTRIHYAAAQEPLPDLSTLQIFKQPNRRLRQTALARRAFLIGGLVAGLAALEGGAVWLARSSILISPSSDTGLTSTPSPLAKCPPSPAIGSIPSDGLITPGVLSWGADPGTGPASVSGAAPYVFYDANTSAIIGFEAEITDAIAQLMGISQACYPTNYKWKIETDLQARNMDIILNGWEITPGRELNETFSDPYYRYSQQLVVRANDSRFKLYTASSDISLTDLKDRGYSFGTGIDYKAADELRNANIPVLTFDNPIGALKSGQVDIIMVDAPMVAYYVQGKGKEATLDNSLNPIGKTMFPGNYVIGFKKNDPNADRLRVEINTALHALKEDGTLYSIYQRWGLWNDFQKDIGIVDCS